MVSIKQVKWVALSSVVMMLSACSSGPSGSSSNSNEPAVDIYAQLKNDTVQYANQEVAEEKVNLDYVLKTLTEVRAAYFRKNFNQAKGLCNRVINTAPDTAEAYYWLSRIAVDENDFNQAYNMSTKALTLAKEPNMKAELKRIQTMTQMGAKTLP